MATSDEASAENIAAPGHPDLVGKEVWIRAEVRRDLADADCPDCVLVRVFRPSSGSYHYFAAPVSQISTD